MKENIVEVLDDKKEALSLIEINDLLEFKTSNELQDLIKNLNELVEENIIYLTKKEKYILYKNCSNFKIGKLSLTKKGYGFVVLPGDDLYISRENMKDAIHDDIVLCEELKSSIRKEGMVLKVLKRDLKNLVGEIHIIDNEVVVELDDEKRKMALELDQNSAVNCVDGTKVIVKIVKELGNNKYYVRVSNILGHKNDPGVDILSIAYKYGIYNEFSKETEEQISNIPNDVLEKELVGRKDLTDQDIFTIDGDDTKDIDDAISIEKKDNIYTLGVHIADVSYYVTENSPLDNDAFSRGTSSYLADTVIPMLPHKLSNGICSLNPNVVRLTLSCVMKIDTNGKIIDYDIFQSYIKSRKQMTYKCVNDILMRNVVREDYKDFSQSLLLMNELAHILRKEKISRGYIDFGIDENKIIQDESGKAIDVKKRIREDGELLIEDFMIAANETIASHIYNMNLPFIYRDHDIPNPEKIEDFMKLVQLLGYNLKHKPLKITSLSMQEMLNELDEVKEFKILSSILLRSMKKADYRIENIGHFGLASKNYTHFTSPIRRYPDLIVHRLLRRYLFNGDISNETVRELEVKLPEIALQCSEREVAAVEAERDVTDMKSAEYMESYVGEEFNGYISGLTNFGMFVELENLIEGLIHVSSLKGDYYEYIPELFSMVGKSTKRSYRLGSEVRVKLVAASKLTSTIDFEIVEALKGDNDGNKQ